MKEQTGDDVGGDRLLLGQFVLDLGAGELLTAEGELAGLRRQALDVLLLLGTRPRQVVAKDEVMHRIWPGLLVGDGSLAQAVADIRRVLGDQDHQIVRNVARRGYMLVPRAPGEANANDPPTQSPAPLPAPLPAPHVAPAQRAHWPGVLGAVALLLMIGTVTGLATRSTALPWQTPAAAARAPMLQQVPALSIALMPLTVEGDAGETDWLADALHGDLITEVQRAPNVMVIGRDTMATYKGKAADPRQVARELGVRHVVHGSLRREGDQIRLNLALVDGESGVQAWAETFVAERATLPGVLNDFAVQVERALQPELYRVSATRRGALSPDQMTADDMAMRAYALWFRGFTRDNVTQGLALVERAVQLDPHSQRGWHGVAFLNLHAALNGWQPDRALALQRIEHAAGELERISRDSYHTYNAKTIILFWKNDVEGMLRLTRDWVAHHPNYPQAHGALGTALMFNGHFDAAVRSFERAMRLSPRDTFRAEWQYRLSMAHFSAGRNELARDWAQTAATTNPGLRWPPVHAAALWRMGQADAARQALADYEARHGTFQPAQVRPRMPGNEPQFASARERLIAALGQAATR